MVIVVISGYAWLSVVYAWLLWLSVVIVVISGICMVIVVISGYMHGYCGYQWLCMVISGYQCLYAWLSVAICMVIVVISGYAWFSMLSA